MPGPWEKYRSSPQGQPIGLQDPAMDLKRPAAAADLEGKQADIRNDAARLALERERVNLARQSGGRADRVAANAERLAALAADKAKREREGRLGTLRSLEKQIGTVRSLYRKNIAPEKYGWLSSAGDYLPTPNNKAFDSAGAGLSELGLAAFRVPGVGSQSDAELNAFVAANRPSASDYDAQIEQKLSNLENRLTEAYRPYGVKYTPGGKRPTNAPRKPARNSDDDALIRKYLK